ncbi:MAG TPA: serine/threonine-protein kinase [Pyrinomonadaceae bacterium]|jgi:serine/threonine protein kinase
MIESGTLLQNRYRVTKQIGQGGMGAVYIATDERFSSTVAVKQTFFDDPALRKAFEREAHLLNHLRHTALPKVSDHFTEGDGQFLVMEFIEGSDLSELLQQRNGAFPVADVLNWADALLDALDYLHTHEPQVIHRDIKPQNLKLTPRGQIVLLDFGLAKGNSTQTRANLTASVFGYSRSYAPLEQIQGTGTDVRSDLYSLAATLYHLLTGAAPVDALTRASAIINGQPDPLRPAHLAHVQVPAAVGEILRRAMSQNAAHRQPTAAEMRAALRRAANALPASARQAAPVVAPQAARSSTDMPTMLEATPLPTYGQQPQSPTMETRATTQLRQPSATHQSETTIVDGAAYGARRRPSTNSFVPLSPDATPERKSKAVFIGVAVAVLVACALVAFPLMRRSPATTIALPDASGAQVETPLSSPTDAQSTAPGASQSEATQATNGASSGAETTNAQAGTRTTRPADESGTANGQTANREGGATNGSDASGVGNNTGGDAANVASPVGGGSAGRSDGLVLHAPAPGASSGRSAAAEYDAQRAEDLRKRQQQQQQQLQQQQRPHPPQHEEEHFRPPPPGGGHRPPPRRPPPF